jgi:Rrf2 family cysteine metabolism transcriptional repressor
MALLNRKVDYAILVLWYLHQKPHGGSAREIADRFSLSRAFVANILKELCHKGFVTSHRGAQGGYVLQRPSDAINLADFIEAMDDSFRLANCNQLMPDDGCALFASCPVKGPIGEIHARIRDVLRNVTLAELFRPAPSLESRPAELVSLPIRAAFV